MRQRGSQERTDRRVQLPSTDSRARVDVSLSQGQISWLHHSPKRPRRSVRAKSCFSEKEHAEITRRCHPQPRPEIRAPHRSQEGVRRNRRGETGRGEAARPGFAERPDTQKRGSAPQEQNGEGRKVKLMKIERAPRGALFCFTWWPARHRTARNTTRWDSSRPRTPDI